MVAPAREVAHRRELVRGEGDDGGVDGTVHEEIGEGEAAGGGDVGALEEVRVERLELVVRHRARRAVLGDGALAPLRDGRLLLGGGAVERRSVGGE